MCYVFDEEVGQTKEMLLISLSAIIESKINILYHMSESNKNLAEQQKLRGSLQGGLCRQGIQWRVQSKD